MRAAVGSFVCLAALTSLAFAAPQSAAPQSAAPQPTYHLRGYYKLHTQVGIWQLSDDSPWQVVKDEPWINPRLVHWGYVPITHDSKHYYCLIDDKPRTGTNILEKTFVCGDPKTVQLIFDNNWQPVLPLYSGH
jgi:hypothetical protein